MKKFIYFLNIIFFLILNLSNAHALRNPFESQLPQKPKDNNVNTHPMEHSYQQNQQQFVIPQSTTTPPPEIPKEPEIIKPNLLITGVIWNSKRPQAIINNQVVDVGTEIEDITIKSIKRYEIEIEYKNIIFNYPTP